VYFVVSMGILKYQLKETDEGNYKKHINTFATKQPFFVHEFVLTRESFQIAAQY